MRRSLCELSSQTSPLWLSGFDSINQMTIHQYVQERKPPQVSLRPHPQRIARRRFRAVYCNHGSIIEPWMLVWNTPAKLARSYGKCRNHPQFGHRDDRWENVLRRRQLVADHLLCESFDDALQAGLNIKILPGADPRRRGFF